MTTRKPTTSKKTTPTPRPKTAAARRRAFFRWLGTALTSRSRDIALLAIVGGAFVAVYDGSLYSATEFGFHGKSAIAFAIMPDALMVLSAAKMRQVGISPTQWGTAHRWMKIALGFSLVTNMIAAFMRNAPELTTHQFVLVGAIAYHGMIVIFLKGAVDVLTMTRADRKARKASEALAVTAAQVSTPVVTAVPVHARPASWLDTGLAWLATGQRPA